MREDEHRSVADFLRACMSRAHGLHPDCLRSPHEFENDTILNEGLSSLLLSGPKPVQYLSEGHAAHPRVSTSCQLSGSFRTEKNCSFIMFSASQMLSWATLALSAATIAFCSWTSPSTNVSRFRCKEGPNSLP